MLDDDAAFFQALQNLQVDFADSTMIGLDVKEALEATSGLNLDNAFQEWYFGEGFPTYSARWNTIGSDLILEISHTTSSSTPTFTNPLEVRFSRTFGGDTIIRVDINANVEQYTFSGLGNVNNLLSLDPNNWIINAIGTIAKDITLTNSIENLALQNDYIISPNPSNGKYVIESEMAGSHNYRVFDTRGRLLMEGSFNETMQLDFTSKANGKYLVQLTSENGDTRVKILVKN